MRRSAVVSVSMSTCALGQSRHLVALGEGILDAGGWLHAVSLYDGRGRGEGPVLEAFCKALNWGPTWLLLLGRK